MGLEAVAVRVEVDERREVLTGRCGFLEPTSVFLHRGADCPEALGRRARRRVYARPRWLTTSLWSRQSGREVPITSPGKVYFNERGETKLDLVRYYQSVEEPLLRAMGGRPVLLQRFPNGASGPSFFQKRVPDTRPDWLETTIVSTPNGTTSRALVAADLAHVLWAVNLGCLGFHVWPSQASDPEHADELRIDLDPSPGVTFAMVQEAAREVRALFDELGVVCLPKTTGNRGIHVYVRLQPRWTSYEVRSAAVAVARELERRRPDLITGCLVEGGARHAASSSTSTRTRRTRRSSARGRCGLGPGAQVSTPFAWDELDAIDPDALTIVTVPPTRGTRRRPVAGDVGSAAVARTRARAARARHRRGAARRAVAAAVSEDARRAVARGAESRAQT